MKRMLVLLAAVSVVTVPAFSQQSFTYVDLVKRLCDLERLAQPPVKGEKCVQWSSYDRASKYDEQTGKYVRWDANGDGGGIIRREGDQSVFAEMTGPGVIWRIWSAKADKGHVRIYLDGAEQPTVDLPFIGYFDRKNEPFVYPSLVHMTARGQNNYVPIPFQKSCKIVADKGWGNYYQFVYTIFPEGTRVPTFKRELSADETAALKAADEFLSGKLGSDPAGPREGEATAAKPLTIEPGKSVEVAALTGPRAITALRVKIRPDSREQEIQALRELTLKITWDGEDRAGVWSPLGDFFGTAPGINKYKSLPMGMTDDELYCLWYMPFAKSARVEIANEGETARQLEVSLTHAPCPQADKLARFHAKWHRDAFLPAEPERAIDWTMLKTQGCGRYVGVSLHVWNPRGGWWGEGDEKFFVDGEKFPSTIGTGSEDYFGYAWCNPEYFQNAFHNQPFNQSNRGHSSNNRWHITDNIPFQTSFEGCIEKYYPNRRPTLYALVAYWYLMSGGQDAYGCVQPASERLAYMVAPEVWHVKGAVEGEKLKVLSCSGGHAGEQDMGHFAKGKWSNESQLWWRDGKPGDKLALALPVEQAGSYGVEMVLTKARDYGIMQLYLDDQKLGEPIDLFNSPDVICTDVLKFPARELSAGRHTLTVEVVGSNPKAVKSHMFGLDYVKLVPQK